MLSVQLNCLRCSNRAADRVRQFINITMYASDKAVPR